MTYMLMQGWQLRPKIMFSQVPRWLVMLLSSSTTWLFTNLPTLFINFTLRVVFLAVLGLMEWWLQWQRCKYVFCRQICYFEIIISLFLPTLHWSIIKFCEYWHAPINLLSFKVSTSNHFHKMFTEFLVKENTSSIVW